MKFKQLIALCLSLLLAFNSPTLIFAQNRSILSLPEPGTMVGLTSSYVPVIVKGLRVHPENPVLFDLILDTGDSGLGVNSARLRSESEKLIKYFLASLTIPEDDLWVNLSPYEKNRIIPEQLGQTIMGRDMLAEDYILKQLTASLIYPEKDLGREFWNKVYVAAQAQFGTTHIPVNTFNKVWIVADKAKVYVHDNTAFVVACHMKVMLEEDYLAKYKHGQLGNVNSANSIGSRVVREVVIPELEKEVNQGKNFANLRQIFNSMVLAAWYKKSLKDALLNQVYSNKAKVGGIDVQDKTIKEKIYQQYLKAYKKGVFNFIKEDVDADGQTIPRKYFSGGEVGVRARDVQVVGADDADSAMFMERPSEGQLLNLRFVSRVLGGGKSTPTGVLPAQQAGGTLEEGDGLFGKEEVASYTETKDKAMVTTEYGIHEIKAAAEKYGTTNGQKYVKQLDSAYRFLLEKKKQNFPLGMPKILVVKDNSDVKGFGIRFYQDANESVIYIEAESLKHLEDTKTKLINQYGMDGDLDLMARELIYGMSGGSEVDRRENEFNYAYEKFPELVVARFPSSQALPQVVLEKLKNSLIRIWDDKGKVSDPRISDLRKSLSFDEQTNIPKYVTETSRRFYEEAVESARRSLYKIAVNALDGVVHLNVKVRLRESDPPLNGNEDIKAGMLAFAGNPPTVAHTVIAMLKSMADNQFDVFFTSLTKGDFRKPALQITYETRQKVVELLIEDLFGGLIKVAPPLQIMDDKGKLKEDPGINGEEKVKEFLRLNKDARSFLLGYVAGLDHYASFVHKDGLLTFMEINKDNIRDFEYYVKMPGYPGLLKKYWELMQSNIPPDQVPFFEKLEDSPNPLSLLKIGAKFPVLDTVGKLYLVQDYLKRPETKNQRPKNTQIALINIGRVGESLGEDFVRNDIAKEVTIDGNDVSRLNSKEQVAVFTNSGFDQEASATILRTGIHSLIVNREFNLSLLRAMHLEVLKMAMGRDHRLPEGARLFGIWLRTQSVGAKTKQDMPVYPRAVETLFPSIKGALIEQRKIARDTLITRVNEILKKAGYAVINVEEYEKNGETVVQVRGARPGANPTLDVIVEAKQGWIAYFDASGKDISQAVNHEPVFSALDLGEETEGEIKEAINDFYKSMNDYSPSKSDLGYEVQSGSNTKNDKAMTTPTGGIDLNAKNLQLDVNGEPINIKFDPAMLAQFQRGDFSGVVPVIIQITPIRDPLEESLVKA